MSLPLVRRIGANVTIVTFLSVLLIDALPSTCTAHQRLKNTIDPALDATGLWQESWRLFAPEPDSVNSRISARLEYSDGTELLWQSPDWQNTSAWQRFTQFRRMEYFDSLRLDNSRAAWAPFANYLAETLRPEHSQNAQPVHIELHRHWVNIPAPSETEALMPVGGDWSGSHSCIIYCWPDELVDDEDWDDEEDVE